MVRCNIHVLLLINCHLPGFHGVFTSIWYKIIFTISFHTGFLWYVYEEIPQKKLLCWRNNCKHVLSAKIYMQRVFHEIKCVVIKYLLKRTIALLVSVFLFKKDENSKTPYFLDVLHSCISKWTKVIYT